ncbi:ACT domain-containing protein [Actinobaculum suis]|nr:ACT domain-containing protein [Actinobaculum suis]MDY5154036.1 ACT domain-containing protein [Actinobaculum suis]
MTVTGRDRTGIVAAVTTKLAERKVNVKNISQTIMSEYFTMILEISLPEDLDITSLQADMHALGETEGLEIRVQSEAIFDAMHRL